MIFWGRKNRSKRARVTVRTKNLKSTVSMVQTMTNP